MQLCFITAWSWHPSPPTVQGDPGQHRCALFANGHAFCAHAPVQLLDSDSQCLLCHSTALIRHRGGRGIRWKQRGVPPSSAPALHISASTTEMAITAFFKSRMGTQTRGSCPTPSQARSLDHIRNAACYASSAWHAAFFLWTWGSADAVEIPGRVNRGLRGALHDH